VEPAAECALGVHDSHALSKTALSFSPNLPSLHSVQTDEPLVGLYVPLGHAEHTAPFVPVKPRLQTQLSSDGLALLENVSAGQSSQASHSSKALVFSPYFPGTQAVHDPDPLAGLNVPATHAIHVEGESLVKPLLQTHSLAWVLWGGELESATQFEHAMAPSNALYLPGTQATQLDEPSPS